MAPEARRRRVELSAAAIAALREVWQWNADQYGEVHADAYLRYLRAQIDALASSDAKGRAVAGWPDLAYLLIQRRTSGHGHLAIYQTVGNVVTVLHLFHTAQNWQAFLGQDPPTE